VEGFRVRFNAGRIIKVWVKVSLGLEQPSLKMSFKCCVLSGGLFTVDSLDIPAFKMEYTITRSTGDSSEFAVKTGTFTVVSSVDGMGSDLVFNDASFENQNPGFSLSAIETTGIVTVKYTDDFADPSTIQLPGTIKDSISYLA
jgi:hypothetical protein